MGPFGSFLVGAADSLLGGLIGGGAESGRQKQTQNTFTQANPFSYDTGLFSGSWKKGKGEVSLSPEMQQLLDYNLMNSLATTPSVMLEANAMRQGFGSNLLSYNPTVAAQQLYSQLAPARERDFMNQYLGLENRLFSQGRLGSSGNLSGQADLEALFRAQEAQRAQDMFKSYGLAQDTQRNLFGLYSAAAGLPATVSMANLQPLFAIQEASLQPMGLFGELAGSRGTQTGTTTSYGPSARYMIGAGLMNAGGSIMDGALSKLFS